MGQRKKSLLSLIPLAAPLIVMLFFWPSTNIQTTGPILIKTAAGQINTNISGITTAHAISGFAINSAMPSLPPPNFLNALVQVPSILSITGILCLIGLAAGGFFALTMLAADDRVARKILHVISLSPSEHQWLQIKVAELSSKLAIITPKIGVVEDLRPNAFTIGYGENTTIVFSIGLLNILDHEEISAVAAHELGHVKHHDFFYKTLASTLTIISFFNPLAYIASSMGQREREMFADERAIELSEKPSAFGNALAKICKALESLPKESILASFSSNLLVSSSVLHRIGILSTHPRLDMRLRNIDNPKPRSNLNRRNFILVCFLSLILVCSVIAVSFVMVNIQTSYTASQQIIVPPAAFKTAGYGLAGLSGNESSYLLAANWSGSVIINSPIYPVISGGNNNTIVMVVHNEGTSVNSQANPFNNFFVVPPQNVSFVP